MIGLRIGTRIGLDIGGPSLAAIDIEGVTRDATSGIYLPASAAEASALLDAAGVTATTLALYLFGAPASGNVTDASGNSKTLTASGTLAYQQAVTGWAAKALSTSGAVGHVANSSFGNVNANSYTIITYAEVTAPNSTRTLMRIGGSFDDDACLEISSTPRLRVGEGDATRSQGETDPTGAVRAFVLRVDDTGSTVDGFTDQEKIVGGTQACNGTQLLFGGDDDNTWIPPTCKYVAAWVLSTALSDADLRTLLETAGWDVGW